MKKLIRNLEKLYYTFEKERLLRLIVKFPNSIWYRHKLKQVELIITRINIDTSIDDFTEELKKKQKRYVQ